MIIFRLLLSLFLLLSAGLWFHATLAQTDATLAGIAFVCGAACLLTAFFPIFTHNRLP